MEEEKKIETLQESENDDVIKPRSQRKEEKLRNRSKTETEIKPQNNTISIEDLFDV